MSSPFVPVYSCVAPMRPFKKAKKETWVSQRQGTWCVRNVDIVTGAESIAVGLTAGEAFELATVSGGWMVR